LASVVTGWLSGNDSKNVGLIHVVSGSILIIMSALYARYFQIDPIDSKLIIHEQAINLTSKHSNNVQSIILVNQFLENCTSGKPVLTD
jgi:hypothetical protein